MVAGAITMEADFYIKAVEEALDRYDKPDLYNGRRPHSSRDRQTPDHAYFNALAPMMVAA